MEVYLIRESQLFYPNKKWKYKIQENLNYFIQTRNWNIKYKIIQLVYPNRLFKKWSKLNCKEFKYNAFQFLRIVEMFHLNTS